MNTVEEGKFAGLRVLVVDDEAVIQAVITAYLEMLGCETIAVSGIGNVQAMLNSEKPFDLFIVDMRLRQGDGLTIAKEIRRNPIMQSTPIIMTSGLYSQEELRALTQNIPNTEALSKPFREEMLISVMEAALSTSDSLKQNT